MDCILLCGPKDEDIIQRAVNGVALHVTGIRYIYVITPRKLDLSNCAVFEETLFPFTRQQVAEATSEARSGWYLQQLLKFYAPLLISNCSDTLLILDADTVFHKRVKFQEDGKYIFDMTREPTGAHFDHMARLHPSLAAWKRNTSGNLHYGIWSKQYLIELMEKVESYSKKDFWEAYLAAVTDKTGSGASEYEIYWHFMMVNHADKIKARPLRWNDFGQRSQKDPGDYHYTSYHWQIQRARRS